MSLIPSESASFPDLLGRGLGASKKSKWRVPHVLDQPATPAAKIESPPDRHLLRPWSKKNRSRLLRKRPN